MTGTEAMIAQKRRNWNLPHTSKILLEREKLLAPVRLDNAQHEAEDHRAVHVRLETVRAGEACDRGTVGIIQIDKGGAERLPFGEGEEAEDQERDPGPGLRRGTTRQTIPSSPS